jgi:hypothetical protein
MTTDLDGNERQPLATICLRLLFAVESQRIAALRSPQGD